MCRSWGWWCWQGMRWTETGFKLASLINFVIFLHSGKYRWFPLTSVLVQSLNFKQILLLSSQAHLCFVLP